MLACELDGSRRSTSCVDASSVVHSWQSLWGWEMILLIGVVGLFVAGVVWLNVWYWRLPVADRAPAERLPADW